VALLVLPKGRIVSGAKPKEPLVRLAKIALKNVGRQKKIQHEALGCRVGKKLAVKFICRPVVSIIVCQFNGCCVESLRLPIIESRKGISLSRSHGSVREALASYGSSCL